MGRIVVGVDGSEESMEALRWGCREAARRSVDLDVVHAWTYPYMGLRAVAAEPRDLMGQDAAVVLERSVEELGDSGSVMVEAHLVEASPIEALRDMSADAELVVVGSRGRGGFASLFLGSVSSSLAGHTVCPTAIVRHDRPASGRIVVGVDGSPRSNVALQFAVDEAAIDRSAVDVVHVFHPSYEVPGPYPIVPVTLPLSDMMAAALDVAKAAIAEVTVPEGVHVEAKAATGAANAVLVEAARDATMLVVGSHGQGGVSRLLIGSVAMSCVRDSVDTPVVVVPTHEDD